MKLELGEEIARTRNVGIYDFHFVFSAEHIRLLIGVGTQQLWSSDKVTDGNCSKIIFDGLRFLLSHLENHLALTKERIAQTLLVRPVT